MNLQQSILLKTFSSLFLVFLLACGGTSYAPDDSDDMQDPPPQQNDPQPMDIEAPVMVDIDDVSLTQGMPMTFTFTVPASSTPYTNVTIDVVRTLEEATFTVTETP